MAELIGSFFAGIFGTHSILATIIIAMVPIIELKGAIPIGMSVDYWGNYALNNTQSFLFSLLGSCLVVPILAIVFIPILNWLKKTKMFRKVATFIEEKVKKHTDDIDKKVVNSSNKKNKTVIKCLLIFAFVAVPLPLTGVWTGTCVAVIIGLKYWQTVLSVVLGNIVAGLIIVFVCSIFPNFVTILSIIFLCIVALLALIMIVKFIMHMTKKDKDEEIIVEENNE